MRALVLQPDRCELRALPACQSLWTRGLPAARSLTMYDGASTPCVVYLAPYWIGIDDGTQIELVELPGTETIRLSGASRQWLLSGEQGPAARLMMEHNPMLSRVLRARAQAVPEPLDRARLMRGAGFSQLFVELTAQCNERCAHCYADSSPQRTEALDEPTVRAVLEDARELGFQLVQLTGGDPLVSDLCVPAAKYAAELGIPAIEIYTNGLALHGNTYEQLRRYPVSFAFSFYSHDPAVHDAITGTRGSQVRTTQAIARVIRDGIPARVNVVVLEQNRAELAATLRCLQDLGVPDDRIGMDVQRSVGRGQMTTLPGDPSLPALPGGHRGRDYLSFGGRAAVSYDGTVYPCIFTRSFPLGSVKKERLRAILLAKRPVAVDRERVLFGTTLRSEEFACWDCRLRAALLPENTLPEHTLPENTLVPLRRRESA